MEKKETKKETNKKNYHNIEIKVEEKSGLMLLIRLLKIELKKLK